jgi:hypothetical protein
MIRFDGKFLGCPVVETVRVSPGNHDQPDPDHILPGGMCRAGDVLSIHHWFSIRDHDLLWHMRILQQQQRRAILITDFREYAPQPTPAVFAPLGIEVVRRSPTAVELLFEMQLLNEPVREITVPLLAALLR